MDLAGFPLAVTDWASIEPEHHPGEQGVATWRTRHFADVRVRMVEFSANYLADHWCDKGHIVLCLEGELIAQLKDGRTITLAPGMSLHIADHAEAHLIRSVAGARVFIVD